MAEGKIGALSKYKLVFLGDQSVGKTSIINRFVHDKFDGNDKPTIGIDFIAKTLYYDEKTVRLQLWDTAGQERFRSLIPSYIRDSSVAIIVYDITSRTSFENVNRWVEYVREERGNDVIICLLGNKADIEEKRAVSTAEGEEKAQEHELLFFETSAKTGQSIAELFKRIAVLLTGAEPSMQMTTQQALEELPNQKEQNDKFGLRAPDQEAGGQQGSTKSGCC